MPSVPPTHTIYDITLSGDEKDTGNLVIFRVHVSDIGGGDWEDDRRHFIDLDFCKIELEHFNMKLDRYLGYNPRSATFYAEASWDKGILEITPTLLLDQLDDDDEEGEILRLTVPLTRPMRLPCNGGSVTMEPAGEPDQHPALDKPKCNIKLRFSARKVADKAKCTKECMRTYGSEYEIPIKKEELYYRGTNIQLR